MKRFLIFALMIGLLLASPALAADEWMAGTGTAQVPGSINTSDIDYNTAHYITNPLNRLNKDARRGAIITYNSAAALTVTPGTVACRNADESVVKYRRTTTDTTVTWANIDAGAEAASTAYTLFADCDADAETFTVKFSTSSTAPTGVTSYRKLGSFYNNSASNISYIQNYDGVGYAYLEPSPTSEGTSYSADVAYQNTTGHKLAVVVTATAVSSSNWFTWNVHCYTGETSSPATEVAGAAGRQSSIDVSGYPNLNTMTFLVPPGWYFKVSNPAYAGSPTPTVPTLKIEAWEI